MYTFSCFVFIYYLFYLFIYLFIFFFFFCIRIWEPCFIPGVELSR